MTNENLKFLTEALITIADNRQQQLFGNIVVFAGGSGSGKGFVLDNLLDVQGKVFDVDKLKSLATRSPKYKALIKEKTGREPKDLDLKNPKDTALLHSILGKDLKLGDKYQELTFASVMLQPEDRKPNLIFDITLKDLTDINEIHWYAKELGYKVENIHIVWVVNDLDVSKQQNLDRPRVVDEQILEAIHAAVAVTMKTIIKYGESSRKYFDGKMFIVFNNRFEDDIRSIKSKIGGFFIKDAKYVQIKKKGEAVQQLDKETLKKIESYTRTNFK